MSSLQATVTVSNATVPTNSTKYIAIVGYSTIGPVGDFTAIGDLATLLATFGTGPAVELAAVALAGGVPVAIWREASPVQAYGTAPTIFNGGGSLASATYDATAKPNDRSFASIKFLNSGAIGTGPISYQVARTYNPVAADFGAILALGAATSITTADGIKINLTAAQTVTATSTITNAEGKLPELLTATVQSALARVGTTSLPILDIVLADNLTAAKCGIISASLDLLQPKGVRPTVYSSVATASVGDSQATYLAAVTSAVSAIVDARIAATASEVRFASAVTGRSPCMYPTLINIVDKISKLAVNVDLRSIASPASVGGQAVSGGQFSGPTIGFITSVTPVDPIGSWDEGAAGDGLSSVRTIGSRFVPTYTGTFVNDSPVLSQAGTAIEQIDHARVISTVFGTVFHALLSYLGQKYDTYATGANAGRLLPYERSKIETGVTEYVNASLGKIYNSLSFALDPTSNLSTGRINGVLTVGLLNSAVRFVVPISATR